MFKCVECEYYSQRNYNIQRHMLIKHNLTIPNLNTSAPDLDIPNQCEQCNKIFTVKSSLKRHLLICKGINKNKLCEHCNKILASKQSKTRHQLTCKEKVNGINIINNVTNNITNNNNTNNQQFW